jgi:hypothetical protein
MADRVSVEHEFDVASHWCEFPLQSVQEREQLTVARAAAVVFGFGSRTVPFHALFPLLVKLLVA